MLIMPCPMHPTTPENSHQLSAYFRNSLLQLCSAMTLDPVMQQQQSMLEDWSNSFNLLKNFGFFLEFYILAKQYPTSMRLLKKCHLLNCLDEEILHPTNPFKGNNQKLETRNEDSVIYEKLYRSSISSVKKAKENSRPERLLGQNQSKIYEQGYVHFGDQNEFKNLNECLDLKKEKYFPNPNKKLERQPEVLGKGTKQNFCATMSSFKYKQN